MSSTTNATPITQAALALHLILFPATSVLLGSGEGELREGGRPKLARVSAAQWEKNRRIEIELLPNLSELPKLLDETEKQATTTEVSAPAK